MVFPKKLPLFLLPLLWLATPVLSPGQLAKDKPTAPKPPAETLVGVWHGTSPAGDEYITFTADGRVFMQRGPAETMNLKYKLDVSAPPWKLDMTGPVKDMTIAVFTVFDFPTPDEFRMATPHLDQKKRPVAKDLEQTKLILKRVTLGVHAGIYQVVEAWLKKMAGSWEVQDGGQTLTLTFAADGTYTMKVADVTDKGRFRVDVTKVPVAIDLLSSEGGGVKYSICELNADGFRVGKAAKNPDERPKEFDDISTKTFKRKAASGTAPK